MDKGNYIAKLFDDIKDNIEFDSDVIAIEILLSKMLQYDVENSFLCWLYIMQNYNISKMMEDIDFSPLLLKYPERFIEKVGYSSFFEHLKLLSKSIYYFVSSFLFNVFRSSSILYSCLLSFINSKDEKGEKEFVLYVLKQSKHFSKEFFDTAEFLKNVICIHLENNYIPVLLLQEFTEYPLSKKDQAILKTLIIDYIL